MSHTVWPIPKYQIGKEFVTPVNPQKLYHEVIHYIINVVFDWSCNHPKCLAVCLKT